MACTVDREQFLAGNSSWVLALTYLQDFERRLRVSNLVMILPLPEAPTCCWSYHELLPCVWGLIWWWFPFEHSLLAHPHRAETHSMMEQDCSSRTQLGRKALGDLGLMLGQSIEENWEPLSHHPWWAIALIATIIMTVERSSASSTGYDTAPRALHLVQYRDRKFVGCLVACSPNLTIYLLFFAFLL